MSLVARDEGVQMGTELVVLVGADMVKFVDRDQAFVESLDPEFVDRETKSRVGADQHAIFAAQEFSDRFHFRFGDARLVDAGCIAEVPARLHLPIRPEAELR